MLKTKDDEFLGDKITSNIKYADNEWQAQGTVDRESTYTAEPLLNLLFEGFNYKKSLGDYRDYVARASTTKISGTDQKTYVAAKLQHDLYVVDNVIYSSSANSSVNNIFSLNMYLKKAIALANPSYDETAKTKVINLLGIKRVANENKSSDFEWKSEALKTRPVYQVWKYLIPAYYTGELPTADSALKEAVEKQLKGLIYRYFTKPPKPNGNSQGGKVVVTNRTNPNKTSATNDEGSKSYPEIDISLSMQSFLDVLNDWEVSTIVDNEDYKLGTLADVFLKDFEISQHANTAIKLPFYNRGESDAGEATVREIDDSRTFKTRFIANSLSRNLYESTDSATKPQYFEFLNDILEESIFTNHEFYSGRAAVKATIQNDESLAKDLYSQISDYRHLDQTNDVAYKTLLQDYVRSIDNIDTSISLYCPEVYCEYSTGNLPEGSWGIHFINEENTENLFQDVDKTYKLYNNVLIGYKLADTLIANRTAIGGFYYILSQRPSNDNWSTIPIPADIPLQQRSVFSSFYECCSDANVGTLEYYPTITIINALYKLGHEEVDNNLDVELPEASAATSYSYDFADEIKEWLSTECFIFKGNVYGDYVEELNFQQDLTPDSDTHFKSIRVKSTEVTSKRYQDSKYEMPFVEQTVPLINNTTKNEEGFGVYGSDALSGVGNLQGAETDVSGKTRNILPPFIYDFDKGIQKDFLEDDIDDRLKNSSGNAQRIKTKNGSGILTAEAGILSPTIDELWTFLKYLTESDGSGVKSGVNERLPKFYGIKKNRIIDTIAGNLSKDEKLLKNTFNPRIASGTNESAIDILNWEPITKQDDRLHWSPADTDKSGRVELQFGGYQVTRFIEKIYDYEIKPFSRRATALDNDTYEYNTENSSDKNSVTGYLEKLYNSAILAFDLPDVSETSIISSAACTAILFAHVLDSVTEDVESTENVDESEIFTAKSDSKLITKNVPVHNTAQRKKAFDDIANILNYHKADGETADASKHNHYKKYLENPKNLKEIERDLETLRQNLQTLAEFAVASFASLGYADRAQNRGTLHQLHKNAYDYLSTYIYHVNNTIANLAQPDEDYNVNVSLNSLESDLNNTEESLAIVDSDKTVIFDDGEYKDRYLRENYDASVLDMRTNVERMFRGKHPMYRANETLLSEVYLAADGTWRSVHEHTVLPVLYSED